MLKGIKKGIGHMNPRHHKGSKNNSEAASDHAGAEAGDATPELSVSQTNVAVAPPGMVAVGPKSMPGPGMAPGMQVMPPGIAIKGPPPGVAMKVMSGGAGAVNSPRRGSISPTLGGGPPPPPPGMKLIGAPPPGVKIMSGPPPPGVKIISGPPPPGAKVMHGSPPPGAVRAVSPVLNGASPPPPGMILSKTPVKLPPGAKLISGSPRLGSRPISPEGAARSGTVSPSLIPSRSISHTNPPVFRILPNGVKVLVSPPPAGAPVKIISKTPPGQHPSPPIKSPPKKMLIKSMVDSIHSGTGGGGPGSRATTPLIPPQNTSFSVGPKATPNANQLLPCPIPVRPGGTLVKVSEAPAVPARPGALAIPHPSNVGAPAGVAAQQQRSQSEELNFQEEEDPSGGSDGDDIQFEEAIPASPPPAPRASGAAEDAMQMPVFSSSSSSSSLSLREDPDAATELPPAKKAGSSAAYGVGPARAKEGAAVAPAAPAKKHRRRHSESGAKEEAAGKASSSKEPRKHRRHRHRRSASSDAGEVSSRQSYVVPQLREGGSGGGTSAAHAQADGVSASSPTGRLSDAAFTPQALTSTSRNRIAEDFLSMLCPQQYYGKVQKISRIRPFKADRSAATGLRSSNSIYVATKGVMPNPYFYPQLRLRDTDGERPFALSPNEEDAAAAAAASGVVNTPIILYEAAPGNMLFADTELDARRLLENNPVANSCFMLSNSAILFRDPEHYVLPIASLNVQWVPYASPQSEPQCPVHKRELQLFDPYSKELVCALCASRNGVPMSNFVVIPDVLGNADSRRTIQEKVSVQLQEAQQSAKRWVEQHQRVRELCDNKKAAIRNQFDLLIEALESKKREYAEACEAEFAYVQTDVAREVLITDEKVQLLCAAMDHLRTDPAQPLFSMQIATIAEGLSASTGLPSRFTRASLQLPPMSVSLVPNLEGLMSQVLELSPQVRSSSRAGDGGGRARIEARAVSNSPYQHRSNSTLTKGHRALADAVNIAQGERPRGSWSAGGGAAAAPALAKTPRPVSAAPVNASPLRNDSRLAGGRVAASPVRTTISAALAPATREDASALSAASSSQKRSAGGAGAPAPYTTNAVSVPNSTGTSLFDFALHDLLSTFDSANVKRRSPRYVQWAIRVEDPGDWVGLGVGVGNTIDAWEQGSTNDLSHLWIVPASLTGQVLYLRVAVNAASGHAKLTVHDARGKQLDGGEVPQWNAARPSYPQATFGGHVGTVRMIEMPHAVR